MTLDVPGKLLVEVAADLQGEGNDWTILDLMGIPLRELDSEENKLPNLDCSVLLLKRFSADLVGMPKCMQAASNSWSLSTLLCCSFSS